MAIYDKLTGIDLSTDGANPGYKKMCLNCTFCRQDEDTVGTSLESFNCINEKVLESGRHKILGAVPEGFEIKTLELGPMKLKNPTKKCPNHLLNMKLITDYLDSYFNPAANTVPAETPSES